MDTAKVSRDAEYYKTFVSHSYIYIYPARLHEPDETQDQDFEHSLTGLNLELSFS